MPQQTKGNINLYARPRVRNPDGSISTVRGMSFGQDGKHILVPTVEEHGRGILSDEDAINQYDRTGQFLGEFATPEEATAYSNALHEAFARGEFDVPLASSRKSVNPEALRTALLRLLATGK